MSAQKLFYAIGRAHDAVALAVAVAGNTPRASVLRSALARIEDARTLAREGFPAESAARLAEAVEDMAS